MGLPLIKKQLTTIFPAGVFYALHAPRFCPSCSGPAEVAPPPLMLAAFLAAILLAPGPYMGTGDMSRSMASAFPAVLIALVELHKASPAVASHPQDRRVV